MPEKIVPWISASADARTTARSADVGDHALRLLVDSIKDYGIIMLTPDGHIASWNSGANAITGYHAEEIIGQHFSVFYPADSITRGWPERELRHATEDGRFEDEGWRVRKDGSRFWANVIVTPFHDEHGVLQGYAKVVRDLSERKRQEESLKQGEERFRMLVEGVTDYAIFMLDEDGRITSWNSGAEAIKGYAAQEVIGTHVSRFYPPEAVARKWPEYELHAAGKYGHFEDEGWRVRKDGSRFWANVIITAMRGPDGGLRGYSKITRDLTERREHENRLRQSEERFRLLVEHVKDYAIFLLDPDGRVMSWNAGAERIKGYSAAEIIGESFARFYPQEDVEAGKPWRQMELARQHGSARDEGWRVHKDGTLFMADVTITALYNDLGKLYGFAKITRDLTQTKRIQTLEAEGRHIHEFLAMLGHELRNPLASIRNAVNLMEMGDISAGKLEWCRSVIARQANHLTRLVDDLLDVSRIARGKIAMSSEEIDLSTVINRGVEAILPLIQARRHNLKVSVGDGPIRLKGDLTRLVQVICNLLHNAAKYTAQGGAIEIDAAVDGPWVAIRVRDNGLGMPADLLGKVFDLFQQGELGLDRSEGGLGIGLTLVEKIVKMHGGSVEARSEGIGHGSEFIVKLPVIAAEATPACMTDADRSAQPDASSRPRRILIVDDNRDAAETMAMLVEAIGHQAETVHEGLSAAAAARRFDPDLALLDIGLPDMDGYQVARQFKGADDLRHIRLVAATGYGQEQSRQQAADAGFDDFLVKPISFEQLTGLIGRLGEGSEKR